MMQRQPARSLERSWQRYKQIRTIAWPRQHERPRKKYILSPQSINFAPSVNLGRRTSHSPARSLFLMTFGLLHWIELLLYNIYVIGYKYKSIREEENNTYNLSAWENRKENIMADKKAIIDETQFEAQYDAEAKLLLAQKPFLANILVRTVKDYMGLNPCDVEKLIEGEPYISTIPVEPGFTNSVQIKGMNSENKVRNEGVAYFDILFYVRTSDGVSKVIINIEAQKSEPTDYDVEMRGLYYAIREVSSQLDREFDSQNYNDIKKVYSIWICMNEKDNMLEKIYLTKNDIIGISRWKDMYEIVNVVIIRLAKTLDLQTEHELHRFLGALFLPELSADEKNDMLENEFDIKMEGDRKELLKSMCNLSQGIKEQGIEQGRREERISTLVTFFKNDGTVAAAKQMLNSSDEDIKIAKERLSMIEE